MALSTTVRRHFHSGPVALATTTGIEPAFSQLSATLSDLFVNKRAALAGLDLLCELFHERRLGHHGVYFDLGARIEAPLRVAPKPKRSRSAA